MRKVLLYLVLALLMLLIGAESASAVWVWTPETKKWENPKNAVRDTPKAQFELGMSYYNAGDYKASQREFKKLLKVYPNSEFAPDAQYYLGASHQKQEEYYEAFLAYQKVIETYPYSEKIDQIIAEQYAIGKIFYEGYKSKILGMAILPSTDKAIEVLGKVVENSPYGKYADSAQYHLGLSYKKMFQYQEAIDAFKKVVEDYPQSALVEDAKFQIGQCYAQAAPKPGYDQLNTEESINEFKELLETSPESEKAKEATAFLDQLKEKKAESIFASAKFYERIKKYNSAQVYYKQILDEYSKTSWAAKALERLEILKNKGKI
jgi:outer membrane protein assembly factor BamD